MGYFRDLGVETSIEPGPSDGTAVVKFVAIEQADIGFASPGVLSFAVNNGMDLVSIYGSERCAAAARSRARSSSVRRYQGRSDARLAQPQLRRRSSWPRCRDRYPAQPRQGARWRDAAPPSAPETKVHPSMPRAQFTERLQQTSNNLPVQCLRLTYADPLQRIYVSAKKITLQPTGARE